MDARNGDTLCSTEVESLQIECLNVWHSSRSPRMGSTGLVCRETTAGNIVLPNFFRVKQSESLDAEMWWIQNLCIGFERFERCPCQLKGTSCQCRESRQMDMI